jgi:hypothetical protein
MRSVTRLVDIENRHHEAGPVCISPNPACRLNVLGAGLSLTEHHHQAKTRDVQANRDHVRRNRYIHTLVVAEGQSHPLLCLGDTSSINAIS